MLKTLFGGCLSSPKTTALGLVGSVIQMAEGGMSWKSALAAAPWLLIGAIAKDHDTTGAGK